MSTPEAAFTVTRTRADYWRGILVNAFHTRWMPVFVLAAPVINAAITFGFSDGAPPEERAASIVGIALFTLVVVLLAMAFSFLLAAFASSRSPGALKPIEYAFSDERVRIRAATASSESQWDVFTGAFEDARVIVLRQHPGLIHIIPKRGVAQDTLARLRQLLRAHLPGRTRLKGARDDS